MWVQETWEKRNWGKAGKTTLLRTFALKRSSRGARGLLVFIFLSFIFLGPYPRHMEVPRLGAEAGLQLSAYTTATAMPDLSCVCSLHYSHRNARSLTHWARPGIEPTISWFLVRFVSHWAMTGTPYLGYDWEHLINHRLSSASIINIHYILWGYLWVCF